MNLTEVQVRWQGVALQVLLREEGQWLHGPWVPAWVATEKIRDEARCTSQAATGALRALLTVGLADRSETSKGLWWKATDAATRAQVLLRLFAVSGKEGEQ